MGKLNLNIGIKLQDIDKLQSQVQKQLDNISKNLSLKVNKIDIKDIDKQLSNLTSKINALANGQKIVPQVDVSQMTKLEKTIDTMQQKLNTSKANRMTLNVDTAPVERLQSLLHGISADSSEKEIRDLQQEISKLGSSDSQILRVNTAIQSLERNISNIKSTKPIDMMTAEELSQLRQAETSLSQLRTLYGELTNGAVRSNVQVSSGIANVRNNVNNLSSSINNASTSTSGLANNFRQLTSYALGGSGLYLLFKEIKDGIGYIKELDSALINLKKVTDESETSYNNFLENAHDIAMDYGSQADKVTEAVTSWVKTGEDINNATELAKNTMVLTKVGDIDDIGKAQEYMLPTLKAFNIEANNSIQIVDKFNNLANNMATDVIEIGEAMSRSSSSMSVAGNTLEQTLALVATAEAQTKSGGDVVGQALSRVGAMIA